MHLLFTNLIHKFFCFSDSNQICTVKGEEGNGESRGTCDEGLICFDDGSCKELGRYSWGLNWTLMKYMNCFINTLLCRENKIGYLLNIFKQHTDQR